MKRNRPFIIFELILLSVFFTVGMMVGHAWGGDVSGRQQLKGYRTTGMNRAPYWGHHRSDDRLWISMSLPMRDPEGMKSLIERLYDPKDPEYRHYLSVEEFTERFGPNQTDYDSLRAFAQTHHLRVEAEYANRLVLSVTGAVSDIEDAFHVTINDYTRPDGSRFYAPDREPSVDLETTLEHVAGLTNENPPRHKGGKRKTGNSPKAHAQPQVIPHSNGGSGPSGTLFDNDFRKAYAPNVTLTGTGQTLGLVELYVYNGASVTAYEQACSPQLNVPLDNIYCDSTYSSSTTPVCDDGESEVELDIEMAMAMAPGLSGIKVYMGGSQVDVLSSIANDSSPCYEVSDSWGWDPDSSEQSTENNLLAQMAARGQSCFLAAGDGDENSSDSNYLQGWFTSDPPYGSGGDDACGNDNELYQTVVGATELILSGGAWSSEESIGQGYFSGWTTGGILAGSYTGDAIPSYQQSVPMTTNHGSTTYRNVPDVAMAGDEITDYQCGISSANITGGTSASAPLWAAYVALVNEQAVAGGKGPVGFINPAIYTIGLGANYTNDFHDITVGYNGPSNQFSAVTGYDLVSGWGSPKGQSLINDLSGVTAATPTLTATATWTATNSGGYTSTPTPTQTWTPTNLGGFTSTFTWTPTTNPLTPIIHTATPTQTSTYTSTNTVIPTSTQTSTLTLTATHSPTVSSTSTSTVTSTLTRTFTTTATGTFSFTPTMTVTNTKTVTYTPTSTNTSTSTTTETQTNTATFTDTSNTNTSTATLTSTGTPTATATKANTGTATETNTSTATETLTQTQTNTNTATATDTVNTDTPTMTLTWTGTATSTATNGNTETATETNTSTATETLTQTQTNTNTATVTDTMNTDTPTMTLTWTGTATSTATNGNTGTATSTNTVTLTETSTSTATGSSTATVTATESSTNTALSTSTMTSITTPTVTGTPSLTGTPILAANPVLYPNPCHGSSTQIQLGTGQSGDTVVEVYTTAFRKVRTISEASEPIGASISLDLKDDWGHDLANGLYYVRVSAGGQKRVVKLLIIR